MTLKDSEVENSMNKNSESDNSGFKIQDLNHKSLLNCVKCGSCKALCPTYTEDATEGMSARGRVILFKKYIDNEIMPSELLNDRIFSCILCGACNRLCPVSINITDFIYEGRKILRDFDKKRRLLGIGLKIGLRNPSITFRFFRIMEGISNLYPVRNMEPFKTLRGMDIRFPNSNLREQMSIFKASRPRGRVAVFSGCTVNYLYPHIGMSLIKSLNALNYDVILPKGEVCCGAPLMGLGLEEDAVQLADKNFRIFQQLKVEAVISPCPTCINFIKNEYRKQTGKGIDNALEVSQFFGKLQPSVLSPQPSKAIYHDPCHSIYSLGVNREPRDILGSIGFNLIEPKNRGCCGFGGTFRLLYRELSEGILEKRIEEYNEADMIVTSCPNCILQLKSGIKDRPIKHITEVISERIIKGQGIKT